MNSLSYEIYVRVADFVAENMSDSDVIEKAVSKEERIAKRILADLLSTDTGKEQSKEKEENKKVEKSRQPIL